MKKKEKHKFSSKHRKRGKKKTIPFKSKSKSKSKSITLQERLDRVYNSVDLRTICCHSLKCCKVGCPQMHFSEFSSLINNVWSTLGRPAKIELICKSVEYFFRNEFEKWGTKSLIKKCLLLDEGKNACKYYDNRPLNCRLYGLWPDKEYTSRVDKFEKAYEGMLTREEIPLNTQCPNVKRVNDDEELTIEVINDLFEQLDKIDSKIGGFSDVQIDQKENYRTFHDWLLFKIFGEEFLSEMTSFMMAADREIIEDQINQLKNALINMSDGILKRI